MGLLKGRIEDYSSPLAGVPARLYAGYFFLRYGLGKMMGGFGGAELHDTLSRWAMEGAYHFYLPFLNRVAIPHAGLFARLVVAAEILVGLLLIVGCAGRLAALLGLFLCLNYLFASGASPISLERPAVFGLLLVTVFATAAGRALGLDALLKRRLPAWIA